MAAENQSEASFSGHVSRRRPSIPSVDNQDSELKNVPLNQSITTVFDWRIPDFAAQYFGPGSEDKIASYPFCTKNSRVQAVLFPRGVGSGKDTHTSLFIRPIKSKDEVMAQDDWRREISWISVAIVKPNLTNHALENLFQVSFGGENDEEILGFEGPGGHGFGQDTLLSHDEILSFLDENGALNFQFSVSLYERDTLQLVEHLFEKCFEESESMIATFGSKDSCWKCTATPYGGVDENGQDFISVFVEPVKNEVERQMGGRWLRLLTGVSVKLLQGQTLVKSKIFTGSFIFSDSGEKCGWSLFAPSLVLDGPLNSYALLVSVTIDPSANLGHLSSPLYETIQDSSELEKRYIHLKERHRDLKTELRESKKRQAILEGTEKYNETLKSELDKSLSQIDIWKSHVTDLKSQIKEVKMDSENQVKEANAVKVAMAQAKARLSDLRVVMEEGPTGKDLDKASIEEKLDSLKMKSVISSLEAEIVEWKSKCESSNAENAMLKWELEQKNREPEALTFPDPPEVDTGSASPDIIQTMSLLVESAKDSIKSAKERSLLLNTDSASNILDLASVTADLATVQAELEIARIPFVEIATRDEDLGMVDSEIRKLNSELDDVRVSLMNTIYNVDSTRGSALSLADMSGDASRVNAVDQTSTIDQSDRILKLEAENADYYSEIERLASKLQKIEQLFREGSTVNDISPYRRKDGADENLRHYNPTSSSHPQEEPIRGNVAYSDPARQNLTFDGDMSSGMTEPATNYNLGYVGNPMNYQNAHPDVVPLEPPPISQGYGYMDTNQPLMDVPLVSVEEPDTDLAGRYELSGPVFNDQYEPPKASSDPPVHSESDLLDSANIEDALSGPTNTAIPREFEAWSAKPDVSSRRQVSSIYLTPM